MASDFDRWEKDPFFSAAEEVQESADRMESVYRTWLHETKDASSICAVDELRRDLYTVLGTAKWQLDEFARAVSSSYVGSSSSAEDGRARHHQFIAATEFRISAVEDSLKKLVVAEGQSTLPWVRLDEGERDELALFLSGPLVDRTTSSATIPARDEEEGNLQGTRGETVSVCSKNSSHPPEWGSKDTKEERFHGHRRTASASADIDTWKITVAEEKPQRNSSDDIYDLPPPRVFSFSGLLGSMEPISKLNWSKNGFRKWKAGDRRLPTDAEPLPSQQLSRGINACYERSKSCLDSCDDSYDKQLYGWSGAVQRQLQRSQYQIQYRRPIQVTVAVVLCLLVFLAWSAV
ncbi:uncharacterized protein LOC122074474 isoform X2 [Macadamia integrifolia]|uniref:uncharacterized protein LOC122074474 isoform X2 n=1 Tax=Macadamia integrifolia TaxID=60698 RepID=UPI001C4F5610|nr:uncharacterized protein LOC122074474 isoform X2 [Macadamia integrifolia]